ncbi:MAG TPA: glycosyltransferase family 4 protein [Candidatus Limnocylindria bacterium]|nr:glycosyltransferase family 4 protein [Candidatus Limnocylindria bacterium]
MSEILIVVQRFGAEVVGGSEGHARVVASRLARTHRVEIATTTAADYWTWDPYYPAGAGELDGLRVNRFQVAEGRDPEFKAFESKVLGGEHTLADEEEWLRRQGPHCPALLEFLKDEGRRFDAVLFYTYIYEPTALGVPIVPERAALISTAHDEAPLRLAPYRVLFHLPRAFGFLTPEERDLVHRTFRNEHIPHETLGLGLDRPAAYDVDGFRAAHGLEDRIVLYLGQVSEGKGCDDLLAAWTEYRSRPNARAAKLVLAGTVRMELPDRPDVVALGRIPGAEKYAALAAADALVLPSRFESLGIVLLEAWQVGTPVVVRADNPVTAGQVARSGGGVTYRDSAGFGEALERAIASRDALGAAGRAWVERETSWDAFDARLAQLVALTAA